VAYIENATWVNSGVTELPKCCVVDRLFAADLWCAGSSDGRCQTVGKHILYNTFDNAFVTMQG